MNHLRLVVDHGQLVEPLVRAPRGFHPCPRCGSEFVDRECLAIHRSHCLSGRSVWTEAFLAAAVLGLGALYLVLYALGVVLP